MVKINKRMVEELIGYKFKDDSLLYQAFHDESLMEENNNLSLKVVGDSALDYIITLILSHIYSDDENLFSFTKDNDEIVELKASILSKRYLQTRLAPLNLKEFYNDGNKLYSEKMLRDAGIIVLKALVGAVAIDSGYNNKTLVRVVTRLVDPNYYILEYSGINYELKLKCFSGDYDSEIGYDIDDSDERIIARLYLNNPGFEYVTTPKIYFTGYGFTENIAIKDACRAAYDFLKREGYLIPTIFDNDCKKIYSYSKNASISKAQEITYKLVNDKLLSKPRIKVEHINKRYYASCYIDEYEEPFYADSSKIDTARRRALLNMLKKINEDIEEME